ncbi:MAG: NAD(P)-dependent oxidoreductase [Acidimicrobiales bacterium]
MRYGYIGLGDMGSAMAGHLLSTGAAVTVFDLDAAAVERAVAQGGTAADSAGDVAASSDLVSICVPAAVHIEAVMTGPGGIAEGAHDGLTLLIHSTVHPDTMTWARDTAAPWGVSVFDACVAGGGAAADEGELAVFAGGTDEMPAAARDLLDVYGSKVIAAGPVGSGAALKIGVNVMTYAQQAAAAASFELVEGAGADTDALVEAWRHTGQLGALTERFLPMLSFAPSDIQGDLRTYLQSTVSIAQKDLELALAMCRPDPRNVAPVVSAVHDAMPAVFGVGDPDPSPEESA